MKEVFYEWIRNMVFYQMLSSIIINMIPGEKYQKYVRFFLGMLFLVISMQPVLKMLQLTDNMDINYVQEMMERELENNKLDFKMEEVSEKNEDIQ